jgi:DNA-binding HxlR family transcriptional regulator
VSSSQPLFHHRWAVPVLAELRSRRGARFVELRNALAIPRDSLTRTLAALADAGLVARNPGYGHPLRPEYVLTAEGARIAAACQRLLAELDGLQDVALRKWSMPVVRALSGSRLRFSELRDALPGVTSRSLALALKELQSAGLVERTVIDDYPPATVYELTPSALRLARALRAFP